MEKLSCLILNACFEYKNHEQFQGLHFEHILMVKLHTDCYASTEFKLKGKEDSYTNDHHLKSILPDALYKEIPLE